MGKYYSYECVTQYFSEKYRSNKLFCTATRTYFFCRDQFFSTIQFCVLSRGITNSVKVALRSCKTRLLNFISVLGYETNTIKRAIKESLILFLRDKLVLHKQVRSILFELFQLFLSPTIPLVLVSLSSVLLCYFLKFVKHRFLSMNCDSPKAKKILAFDSICGKYH